MKKVKVFSLTATIIIVGIATVLGVYYFASHYLNSKKQTGETASKPTSCESVHANHQVVIEGNQVTPAHTEGHRCDSLTILNKDNTARLIAFGVHEKHTAYDGITEKLLSKGQNLTVTLNQIGEFKFHDHLHDEVGGTFTVIN